MTSTRSFIELDERTESQDTLEDGRAKGARVHEIPIQNNFSPDGSDAYGHRAIVEVGVSEKQEPRGKRGNAIIMTTTLDQSERRL